VSSGATQFSTNNPVYGALIHLKSSVSVPGLTSNAYCQAVLYAMQDYGAYTADTSDSSGVYPYTEGDQGYNLGPFALYNNPWTTNISALGGSLNTYFSGNDGCFSLITSGGDIEVMYLKGNGLPPVQPYWQSTGTPSG
jgi:hypothetical protein